MSKRALILVDIQPTFCEGGELAVAGGNAVAQASAAYVAKHRGRYDLIVTTQDWHIDPGDHFSNTPDFVDSWPIHGKANTSTAELHPALAQIQADISIKKGQYCGAYSGFEGTDASGKSLADLLKDAAIDEVDVCGLALSHCVCETALDAKKLGFYVRVLRDLSAPVTEELGEVAVSRMQEAHINVLDSHTL